MRALQLLTAGLIVVCCASAGSGNPRPTKMMTLHRAPERIVLDGVIDPAWSAADSVVDFFQLQPFFDKPPTRRSVAKLLSTDDAIYCLMVCYDDRKNIQNFTGKLDDFSGDIVSVMFDTFGDRRTAYKFAVCASGVRMDCRLLDDGRNRDYSWDGVWFAESKVYDWGFVVEMEIPYRSIQYDEKLEAWGLDFDRWVPAATEDLYWNRYEESEGQRISKFGSLDLNGCRPTVKALNFEVYPVGIAKATHLSDGNYKVDPNAGVDVFYNPSQKLTFQLTGNPDFAQIEADPYNFNISRYESYFQERRPFFTQGNEVFMPSGRERNSGFYQPMELFYSRRIGKKLPDGNEVPLLLGTKAFGRIEDWEYGGFLAMTDQKDYRVDTNSYTEPRGLFGAVRLKRQIFDNSSIGTLFVTKRTPHDLYAVLDIDGALRQPDWQLSYQLARSMKNSDGDYAASLGLVTSKDDYLVALRGRFIGARFDVSEIGFVPWLGTAEVTGIAGPRWYYDAGSIRTILLYAGGQMMYKDAERHYDYSGVLGLNMQFRSNWGGEITMIGGRSKDSGILYDTYEFDLSTWFNISPRWDANFNGAVAKTYNFRRGYAAYFAEWHASGDWKMLDVLGVGASLNSYIEWNPNNVVEDVIYNTRPYISLTPVNDLNMRLYVDNVFVRSTDHVERVIVGFLFSYNFLPKSWVYFAVNDVSDRSDEFDPTKNLLPNRLHTVDRVGVLKVKYLYYF